MSRVATPWIQTASGLALDLLDPQFDQITRADIAEHLAKTARFNGATPGVFFSVAQHSVNVADAIFAETGSLRFAARGLVHDCPEYALGDDTSPKKRAIVEKARRMYGADFADKVARVLPALHDEMDAVIARAFGLSWPPTRAEVEVVKRFDLIMLETEAKQLMAPAPQPWVPTNVQPLDFPIRPWGWEFARHTFLLRADKYIGLELPHGKTRSEQSGAP